MYSSPPETRASLILRLHNAEDVAAWDTFVNIYAPAVFRVAIRQGMQTADADNLVQEVLLSVAKSVSGWLEREDRGSFRAWLLRISKNHAINMLTRRQTRALGTDGMEAERLLAAVPASDELLNSQFELEYQRQVFQWASRQVQESVAEHTWQAFWLTQIEGMTIEDTAKQLSTNVGNIYFARSRVMSRLRELVKQYEVS